MRTPKDIIGEDKLTQLIFEGYMVVPVAGMTPNEEIVNSLIDAIELMGVEALVKLMDRQNERLRRTIEAERRNVSARNSVKRNR